MKKSDLTVATIEKINDKKAKVTFTDGSSITRNFYKDLVWVYGTPHKITGSASITEDLIDEVAPAAIEENPEELHHEKYELIISCVKNNIPVYLVGPAGSGKNHTLEQIAWELGLDFYFTNSIQQEYKVTGFIDAGGKYYETEFFKAFKDGGLFFLDEMDASIPEVLVLLNAAIANKYFEFPAGRIHAHKDFRIVAAGNTCGNGANEMYTGRLVLDQATLDRFAVIEFNYDIKIEMKLAKGNTELVTFIRKLREIAENNGIRATFSYRCITMTTQLETAGIELKQIMQIAIFKGLDAATIKTFSHYMEGNRYLMVFNREVK